LFGSVLREDFRAESDIDVLVEFAYHVFNRANARMRIFYKPEDYEAFERILVEAVRRCVNCGQPFGSEDWVNRMTKRFGLDSVFRPRGRPRKESPNNGS